MNVSTSVVIPARNAAETIGYQLDALAQEPLELATIIVADNGSTDETAAVVGRFADRLPLEIVDASARAGSAAARNIGVAATTSDVLLFLDADDLMLPGWFSALRAAAVEGPVGGPVLFASRSEARRGAAAFAERRRPTALPVHDGVVPFQQSCNFGLPRTVFDAVGGFDERFRVTHDIDLSIRLADAGYPVRFVEEACVVTTRRPDLRGAARQFYEYGRDEALLRREHPEAFRDLRAKQRLRRWIRIPATLPRLRTPEGRYGWVTNAACCGGRIVGAAQLRRGSIG